MRIAATLAVILSLGFASGAALATEQASSASCAEAGSKVAQALANQSNDQAQKERRMALEFCNAGYYQRGMVHYAKAMELLGLKG
ncbi:MAG TPA: hypothetical protein VG843_09795 [Rhizomicrobium sp.]|jgi:hypothetical protein|nr:hypothetical protein [Rhizomicrobium sp.]